MVSSFPDSLEATATTRYPDKKLPFLPSAIQQRNNRARTDERKVTAPTSSLFDAPGSIGFPGDGYIFLKPVLHRIQSFGSLSSLSFWSATPSIRCAAAKSVSRLDPRCPRHTAVTASSWSGSVLHCTCCPSDHREVSLPNGFAAGISEFPLVTKSALSRWEPQYLGIARGMDALWTQKPALSPYQLNHLDDLQSELFWHVGKLSFSFPVLPTRKATYCPAKPAQKSLPKKHPMPAAPSSSLRHQTYRGRTQRQ